MIFPRHNISSSKKGKSWIKDYARAVRSNCSSDKLKIKDKFCYDFYYGMLKESDFDYLTKVGEMEYPAKIRFIPLVRPQLDLLSSENIKRPMITRVFTVDLNSTRSKQDVKVKEILDYITTNIALKVNETNSYLSQIEQYKMQLAQSKEQGQDNPEAQQAIAQAEQAISVMEKPLQQQQIISQEELEKFEEKYTYHYKDYLEIISQKGLDYLIAKYKVQHQTNLGFIDRLITDKEYYAIDVKEGSDPIPRKVSVLNLWHSLDENIECISDCEWVMEDRYMPVNQIIDLFGDDPDFSLETFGKSIGLSDADINSFIYDYNRIAPNGNVEGYGTGNYGSTEVMPTGTSKIRVSRIVFQSPRKFDIKKTPNKHEEGSFFTKIMSEKDSLKDGDIKKVKYVNEVFQCYIIGGYTYAGIKKLKVPRSVDNFSKVKLPYVGTAYDYVISKPYSLIWATKDIQEQYNIMHYHRELWVALSGVKGSIMDASQLPLGMSMEEWEYAKKTGTAWIESKKNGVNHTFNQFQTYDDSVSPAIQYIDSILISLEETSRSITGVSRQRTGTVVSTDQVGSNEQSIQQSSLITEILYYKHDQVIQRLLTELVSYMKILWEKGKRGQYVLGDFSQQILQINKGEIGRADYEVFVADNNKEQQKMDMIRQSMIQEYSKGAINVVDVVKSFNIDSVKELELKLEDMYKKGIAMQQQSQQSEQEAEAQKIQMQQEFDMMLEQQKNQLEQYKIDLDAQKLEFEKQKFQIQSQIDSTKNEQDNSTKLTDIATERKSEMAYLEEEKRQANMEFLLNKIELAMNGASNSVKIDKVGTMEVRKGTNRS